VKFTDEDYDKILENIIGYKAIVLTGGDDHGQIAKKLSARAKAKALELRKQGNTAEAEIYEKLLIIWAPKTVDNDILGQPVGFDTAYKHMREENWRMALIAKKFKKVVVNEIMGRDAGWLTYESGRINPPDYDELEPWLKNAINETKGGVMVLVPEKPVSLQQILEQGVRMIEENGFLNIRVAEGFSIASDDPLLKKLLNIDPYLKAKIESSKSDLDVHGNPRLLGVSKVIEALFHYMPGIAPDMYYRVRDKIKEEKLPSSYTTFITEFISNLPSLCPDLVPVMNGKAQGMSKGKLTGVRYNIWINLFRKGLSRKECPTDLRRRAMEDFTATAISAWAHKRSSVVFEETGTLVDVINNPPKDMPFAVRYAFEKVRPSIIIANNKDYPNLRVLAEKVAEVISHEGYANVVLAKDFAINKKDPLFTHLLSMNEVARERFDNVEIGV
jgi:hypothetical protein